MSRWSRFAVALLAGLALGAPSRACLWDRDTTELERLRQPPLWLIVAGLKARLEDDVLETRAADTRTRLAVGAFRPALADDLAVALVRLGRPAEAVAVLRESDRRAPGRFETLANLGTALLAAGQTEEGIAALRRALRVNAHPPFLREPAELLLREYLVWRSSAGSAAGAGTRFTDFLRAREPAAPDSPETLIRGIGHLLLLGEHDDVTLLEALGHLTLEKAAANPRGEATWLPARAFLRAAALSRDAAAKAEFRRLAADALSRQQPDSLLTGRISLGALEAQLERETAVARGKNQEWRPAGNADGGEQDRLVVNLWTMWIDEPETHDRILFQRQLPRAVFWTLVTVAAFLALRRWVRRATTGNAARLRAVREQFRLDDPDGDSPERD